MMSVVEQIGNIVEQMPKNRQFLVLELVKTMLNPDDYLSEEDIKNIQEARAEFARGEGTNHNDINWD